MSKKRRPKALSCPECSTCLLLRVPPAAMYLFRFLLEGYDNLAMFTVLDPREGLIKVLFSPHQEFEVRHALQEIADSVSLQILPWPCTVDAEGAEN